jgi:hypothetical protein
VTRIAVTRFELEANTRAVGVPVFGAGGDVVAALELTLCDPERELQPLTAALSIAARSLSRELASAGVRAAEGIRATPPSVGQPSPVHPPASGSGRDAPRLGERVA